MDQATPPWRTFSSEAPPAGGTPAGPARRHPRWLVPALVAVGVMAAGFAAVALLVVAVSVAAPTVHRPPSFLEPLGAASELGIEPAPAVVSELVVDVAGAVAEPGLHRMRPGDRVGDAIEAAGGFAPRADLTAASTSLNLAQPLEDGSKVLVPELGIDRPEDAGAAAHDGRIDLNGATRSELESLPGVGPVTAGKIIEARESERFEAVRELRSRGLVGEKVFQDIEGLVGVS